MKLYNLKLFTVEFGKSETAKKHWVNGFQTRGGKNHLSLTLSFKDKGLLISFYKPIKHLSFDLFNLTA